MNIGVAVSKLSYQVHELETVRELLRHARHGELLHLVIGLGIGLTLAFTAACWWR